MNGGIEMDAMEKLIDLIIDAKMTDPETGSFTEYLADHLISNGVTVHEWVSVDDRLPEEECRCLVIDAAGDIEIDCYDGKGRFVLDRIGAEQHPSHWMPLPPPPKGE